MNSAQAERRKMPLSIYVEPATLEALRALNRRTRVPIAIYLREAIDHALAHPDLGGAPAEDPERKELYSASIEVSQREGLRALSERTKVPMALYIREGLRVVLERHRQAPDILQVQQPGAAAASPQGGAP